MNENNHYQVCSINEEYKDILAKSVVKLVKMFFLNYSELQKTGNKREVENEEQTEFSMITNETLVKFYAYDFGDNDDPATFGIQIPVSEIFSIIGGNAQNIFLDTASISIQLSDDDFFMSYISSKDGLNACSIDLEKNTFYSEGVEIIDILQACKAVYHNRL